MTLFVDTRHHFAFSEVVYYTPADIQKMKEYNRLIRQSEIVINVDQNKFPKDLVATTRVVNRETRQPMPQFKITWIVNNKPQGHQPSLSQTVPKTPKQLNVTVVASLPQPEFHRVSTQLFFPHTGERFRVADSCRFWLAFQLYKLVSGTPSLQ